MATGGQYALASGGQFALVLGGQFEWFFQRMELKGESLRRKWSKKTETNNE